MNIRYWIICLLFCIYTVVPIINRITDWKRLLQFIRITVL